MPQPQDPDIVFGGDFALHLVVANQDAAELPWLELGQFCPNPGRHAHGPSSRGSLRKARFPITFNQAREGLHKPPGRVLGASLIACDDEAHEAEALHGAPLFRSLI